MRAVRLAGAVGLVAIALVLAPVDGVRAGDDQRTPALEVPKGTPARLHIVEGIKHYKEGHMDVASYQFRLAVQADPQSAEAHYDLALALDGLGDHLAAAKSFARALELAPKNPAIADSAILHSHLKKSQSELIMQR